MSKNKLLDAIQRALYVSSMAGTAFTIACIAGPANAQSTDQTTPPPQGQKAQNLETIVVTGSHIRRVDLETSNPVVTIDHTAIQNSGKLTLGDLIQDLPSNAGESMNTQVNNGGDGGASGISLRGLGSSRTLVLIDGHRLITGNTLSSNDGVADVNLIPASMVDRIEVLSDGASAIYGSDAIGGVVNIIMRKNYQGAEMGLDYGISDHDDGLRKGFHFTFGQTSDKGSIIAAVDYNKQEGIPAANRAFSSYAHYLSSGSDFVAGSSRTPTGNITLPPNLQAQFGCPTVTLNAGATGTALSDFRCYVGATDSYNYQAVGNYSLTPSERSGAYFSGDYHLTDNIDAYAQVLHNKSRSATQTAPLPVDSQADGLLISAQNYYNPFGVDFGRDPATGLVYNQFKTRVPQIGNRTINIGVTNDQANLGLKGNIGASSWNWDLNFNFTHQSANEASSGILLEKEMGPGLGPSFFDPTANNGAGGVVCGTPGNVIAGCTPINIFNLFTPESIAAIQQYGLTYYQTATYQTRMGTLDVNGNLFDLPAGSVQLAAGISDRKEYTRSTNDYLVILNPANNTCFLPFSQCTTNSQGSYDVKEAYGEMFVPILHDVPFASSLNLTLGDRYSKYSSFGSTNNFKAAIEYKPIEDLLLRGTVSSVFRAPTLSNLYNGGTGSAPTVLDPCQGLVGTNAACQYVPGDGTFVSTNTSQINAISIGNKTLRDQGYQVPALTPENGKSFDLGFVYDPHWVDGLSLNADLYRIYLNNTIVGTPGTNVESAYLDSCFNISAANGGGAGGPFCSLIQRIPNGPNKGQILFIEGPYANLGRVDTKGADFGVHYKLPETPFGNFIAVLQATYVSQFNNDQTPGEPGDQITHIAGHYSTVWGSIPRWRGLGELTWNLGPWNADWKVRYIGHQTVGYPIASLGPSADGAGYAPPATPVFKVGAVSYSDISVGYNIEPINTMIQVGIDNAFDKQPPRMYQNNVTNGNSDAFTYDFVGRYYFASITMKF